MAPVQIHALGITLDAHGQAYCPPESDSSDPGDSGPGVVCVWKLPRSPATAPDTLDLTGSADDIAKLGIDVYNDSGIPYVMEFERVIHDRPSVATTSYNGKTFLLLRTQACGLALSDLGEVADRMRSVAKEAEAQRADPDGRYMVAARIEAERLGYAVYTASDRGGNVFRKLPLSGGESIAPNLASREPGPDTLSALARATARDVVASAEHRYSRLTYARPSLQPSVPTRDQPLLFEPYVMAELRDSVVSPRMGVNLNLRLEQTLDSLIQVNIEGDSLRSRSWWGEPRNSEALRGHVSWQPLIHATPAIHLSGLITVGGEMADDRPRAVFERAPATAFIESGASMNLPFRLPTGVTFGADLAVRAEISSDPNFRARSIPFRYSIDFSDRDWSYNLTMGTTTDLRLGLHRPQVAIGGFVSAQLGLPWGMRLGGAVDLRAGHLGDVGEIEPLQLLDPGTQMPLNMRIHGWIAQAL